MVASVTLSRSSESWSNRSIPRRNPDLPASSILMASGTSPTRRLCHQRPPRRHRDVPAVAVLVDPVHLVDLGRHGEGLGEGIEGRRERIAPARFSSR
jgi:hypothetical protein